LPAEFKGEGRKKQIEDLTRESTNNFNDAKKFHKDKLAAEKERDEVKEANSTLQKDLADKGNEITRLNADVADRDNTINQLKKTIEDNKDLPSKIKELTEQLGGKDAELAQKNETINSLTNERDNAIIDKKKAEGERDALQAEKNDLIGE